VPDFLPALTGSFSSPAAGNPTGQMMEAAYRAAGLHARYVNCEVGPDDLRGAVAGAWAMGWLGFNCSLPHKVSVIELLTGLGESASIIGAVNCAVRTPDGFRGENTDGQGFLSSLRSVVDPTGKRVVVYGAGGAARAIVVELALAGAAEIVVVNRDAGRGQTLVDLVTSATPVRVRLEEWTSRHPVPGDADVVVNATSVGLYPDVDARLDVDCSALHSGQVVADVVFNPAETALLRDAAAAGCTVLDGRGMLVEQGVVSARLWTGAEVDSGVMREALDALL